MVNRDCVTLQKMTEDASEKTAELRNHALSKRNNHFLVARFSKFFE